MQEPNVREIILETISESLEAQLRAIRRLRGTAPGKAAPERSMSNMDIIYDILARAGCPLHVSEIIQAARKRHRTQLDRESIVSALSKRIARGDRFARTGPNTFALKERNA